jgi:MOSC domain-containing protein
MPGATVAALTVYPIKSCRGVSVERALVGPRGLVGDREWQVVSEDGGYLTQRTHPILARVRPRHIDGGLRVEVDGFGELTVERPSVSDRKVRTLLSADVLAGDAGDDAAQWFSDLLGDGCRLVAMTPDTIRRLHSALDSLFDTELAFVDAAPVHVVNRASHEFLASRATESFGVDRFRANVLIQGAHAWAEDTWAAFRIGASLMRSVAPWPRCAVPQVDQQTGERHREPALVLRAHRWCADAAGQPDALAPLLVGKALFGIGCVAGPEGAELVVGDGLTVVETHAPVLAAPVSPQPSPPAPIA